MVRLMLSTSDLDPVALAPEWPTFWETSATWRAIGAWVPTTLARHRLP